MYVLAGVVEGLNDEAPQVHVGRGASDFNLTHYPLSDFSLTETSIRRVEFRAKLRPQFSPDAERAGFVERQPPVRPVQFRARSPAPQQNPVP